LKYDLHIHSCLSPCGDGDMTPNNIAGMAMLNGIELVALTDHNSTLNCPAFFKACEKLGITPIGGMELTTSEDIHMVCLFSDLGSAMSFGEFVSQNMMKIKNRPDIFGEQIILDENDEEKGRVDDLLVVGTNLDLSSAYDEVMRRGGAAFPAHVDKMSNGLITILGDFPPEPVFGCAEFKDRNKIEEYKLKYSALTSMRYLNCSDAHFLDMMLTDPDELPLKKHGLSDNEIRQMIIKYIRGENTMN